MAALKKPVYPTSANALSNSISVGVNDDTVYYFYSLAPIFNHHIDDIDSFRLITSQLYDNGNCKQVDIIKFFHVSSESVKRAYKKYRENGPGRFFEKPIEKDKSKARVLTLKALQKAQEQLDSGLDKKDVAKSLGIKIDTFRKAIKAGKLSLKKTK